MIFQKLFGQVFHRGRLSLKHVLALFSFIFVVWAVYRHFPESLPLWFEELILKPLLWLGPTFWLVRKIEKEKTGLFRFYQEKIDGFFILGDWPRFCFCF